MAKKKLVPEYQFSLGSESKIEQSTIKNIYDSISDSEKGIYGRIAGVRVPQSNSGVTLAEIARNFIRKNTDDTVTAEHSFTKGIRSNNYAAGIGGVGYRLFKDENGRGNLEIDNISVRGALHTTFLTYDKVNAVGGTMVLSSAWATIDKTTESGGGESHRIKCYYKPDGLGIQSWVTGDQARLQRGIDKFLLTVVTDVSDNADEDGYFWVELYHGEDYAGGTIAGASTPEEGDVIVQWGHRGSAAERKNIILLSVGSGTDAYPYIEQYAGIDSFDVAEKLVARISNDVYFGEADKSKYLWWNKDGNGEMMIKGVLTVSQSDTTFPITTFRGEYDDDTMYYYGDVVVYDGASYVMISQTPVQGNTPSPGVTWDVYASGGAAGDVGQTIRYTAWIAGVYYYAGNKDDGGTNNNPSRIVDYVTFVGYDNILRAYKCTEYHGISSDWNSPDNDEYGYWEQISYIPAIASDVVLARTARIGGFVFSPAINYSGELIPMSQQEMRTENESVVLRGDGSGQLATGRFRWTSDGEIVMGKSDSSATVNITTGNIPSISDIENKEQYIVDDYTDSVTKYYENPADDPYQPSIARESVFELENNGVLNVYVEYTASGSAGVTEVGLDSQIKLEKFVSGSWSTVASGDGEYTSDTNMILSLSEYSAAKGTYRVTANGICGGTAGGTDPSITLNIEYGIDYRLIVKKVVVGIDGFAIYDTATDNYLRISLDDDGVIDVRGDSHLMSPNGVHGLRITNDGVQKTSNSGATWTSI